MLSYNETREGSGMLPRGFRDFVTRRAEEIFGVVLVLAGVWLALVFVSYSPEDPSWSRATGRAVANFGSHPGAYVADGAFQIAGVAAFLAVVTAVVYGFRSIFHVHRSFPWARLIFWPLALALTAGFVHGIGTPSTSELPAGLGGVLGRTVFEAMAQLTGGLGLPWPGIIALLLLVILAVFVAAFTLGFSLAEVAASPVVFALEAAHQIRHVARNGLADFRRLIAIRPKGRLALPSPASFTGRSPAAKPAAAAEEAVPSLHSKPSAARGKTANLEGRPVPARPDQSDADDEDDSTLSSASAANHRGKAAKGPSLFSILDRATRRQEPEPVAPDDEAALYLPTNPNYRLPPLGLLQPPPETDLNPELSDTAIERRAEELAAVLKDFGIKGEITGARPGPVVTLFELAPAPGLKSSRVIGLADDIARSMSAISARVAVIPGQNLIGIEIPNKRRETVYLRELLDDAGYEKSPVKLALALGKTIGGEPTIVDLARMPHLLIAGTTGSGKSVAINTMILSILYRLPPSECRVIMIDPKMLELSIYEGIPHLLAPVVTEPKQAIVALKWTVREMEDRYRKMSKLGVRNIAGYNSRMAEAQARGETITREIQTGVDPATGQFLYEDEEIAPQKLPYIVVIVDEMADLMLVAGKEIEAAIQRLAQMARAAGIHLIMATQRPSVDVITGTIKANFPTRISFQVSSKIDSRTILGEQGAEQLLGQGDMLYMAGGGKITRLHGPFVSDEEVEEVVSFLKTQGPANYVMSVLQDAEEGGDDDAKGPSGGAGYDPLFDDAVDIVARERKASTSYLQRRLQIGYNRAARLIESLEVEGVVSPANHAGKREVLVPNPARDAN